MAKLALALASPTHWTTEWLKEHRNIVIRAVRVIGSQKVPCRHNQKPDDAAAAWLEEQSFSELRHRWKRGRRIVCGNAGLNRLVSDYVTLQNTIATRGSRAHQSDGPKKGKTRELGEVDKKIRYILLKKKQLKTIICRQIKELSRK